MEGVNASFRIADCDGTLLFERAVLIYDKETVIEKRPWQFETLFAWSVPDTGVPEESETVPVTGCLASRKIQRTMRHAVRCAEKSVQLTGYEVKLCGDAAHIDRPGKKELEHLDLQDLFQLYCWANRQLSRKELSLTIAPAQDKMLPGSLILEHLAMEPEILDDDEEEYDEE